MSPEAPARAPSPPGAGPGAPWQATHLCPSLCLGSLSVILHSPPPQSLAPMAGFHRMRSAAGRGLRSHFAPCPRFHYIREVQAWALTAHRQSGHGQTALLTSGHWPPSPLEGWATQFAHSIRCQVYCQGHLGQPVARQDETAPSWALVGGSPVTLSPLHSCPGPGKSALAHFCI